MIVWLDHKLFGNGCGLKSPYCDDVYYWIGGEFYTFTGGCLQSFQWTTPKPGEERHLVGKKFRVFNTSRTGPRVRVTWALAQKCTPTIKEIHELKERLDQL